MTLIRSLGMFNRKLKIQKSSVKLLIDSRSSLNKLNW